MSEAEKAAAPGSAKRTIHNIQADYSQNCTVLGDLTYKRSQIEEELNKIDRDMRKLEAKLLGLNKEAHALRTKEAAAAQTEVVEGMEKQATVTDITPEATSEQAPSA